MKLTGRFASAALRCGNTKTSVVLDVFGNHVADLEAFGNKVLDIEINLHREKRSIKANNLCWELCTQIGRTMTPPLAKEDVYRDAIRAVGEYDQYYIKEEALDSFMEARKILGVGWFSEIVGDAPLRGWVEVFDYIGSSTYDTKAMSLLIDYLVDQARQMELPIAYDLQEIERIKESWMTSMKERNSYEK